ncbi:aspartate 1-decarboxylase [candidate division KSB1 bacterium]|nr:MAG: aspartate 1-decarboxylase [candidate division KSB1 bacterium]
MKREMMGAKIHGAHVTHVNLHYEGSCAIDQNLLDAAGILPYERVHIYNVTTGVRLDTYAIPAKRGSGSIGMNGATARLEHIEDIVIIVTYVQFEDEEIASHRPTVVVVDEHNRPVKTLHHTIRSKS